MAPSVSQIIVLVGGSVAFLLLTVGIFYPHWLKPFDKSDYTVPLFGAVYCIGDVCYSAAVVPVDYYYEPGWLMAGRILSCFGLFSVIGGMISQLLYMRWQTDLLHIMALILFATGGFFTFIVSFVFIAKFSKISAAYQVMRIQDSLTYNSLPVALILLASVTSIVTAVASGAIYKADRGMFLTCKRGSYLL